MASILVALLCSSLLTVAIAILLFLPAVKGANKSVVVKSTVTPSHSRETQRTFTKGEVSKHNTQDDCWIIIKNKVYNVTPYVDEHPGGYAILNHAGGDSTEGFYGPQHASSVFDMVDEFYLGDLK